MTQKFERAVFLDRDGTIIEEVGYLDRPERVELFPYTIDAIRVLNRAGLAVVLVSNQSGIARGFFTAAVVDEVHRKMEAMLAAGGAHIDAYYYCPHHPDCRNIAAPASRTLRAISRRGVDGPFGNPSAATSLRYESI